MKNLILALLIICSSYCNAQQQTKVYNPIGTATVSHGVRISLDTLYTEKQDSIHRDILHSRKNHALQLFTDGFYAGYWSGYKIEIEYKNMVFEIDAAEGVRGFNVRVVVIIDGDKWCFKTLNN